MNRRESKGEAYFVAFERRVIVSVVLAAPDAQFRRVEIRGVTREVREIVARRCQEVCRVLACDDAAKRNPT